MILWYSLHFSSRLTRPQGPGGRDAWLEVGACGKAAGTGRELGRQRSSEAGLSGFFSPRVPSSELRRRVQA